MHASAMTARATGTRRVRSFWGELDPSHAGIVGGPQGEGGTRERARDSVRQIPDARSQPAFVAT